MASIMEDCFHHCEERPRILGLTASFVNGKLTALDDKRRALQQLMLSNLIHPAVPDSVDVKVSVRSAVGDIYSSGVHDF